MELRVERIWRNFGDKLAISDVSTSFRNPSITTVLGANGAGKSTLLRLIAGHIPAATGRITLGDSLVAPSRVETRRQLMLVEPFNESRRTCITPILKVIDDYQLVRESLPEETTQWFERLNLVGVYGQSMKALSKGQRYKIALVGLFLTNPHVWILDEPFSCGLDANGISILQQQFKLHRDQGGIVIFSTQWPKQASDLADRVLVIDEGRLVWDEPFDKKPTSQTNLSPALKAVFDQLEDAHV